MSRLASVRERLAGQYRASLRVEAAEIQALLAADALNEAEMHQRAHKLRGSGGSFGYPDISDAASLVEEATSDTLAAAAHRLLELLIKHGAAH